jgi:hypothetical protein
LINVTIEASKEQAVCPAFLEPTHFAAAFWESKKADPDYVMK